VKKIIALLLVVAMTAAASVAGTVAYLSDTDSDVNVMTLGSVYIKQHEYERELDANGEYVTDDDIDDQESYVLKPFTQGKEILPIVGDPSLPGNDPAYAGWDDTTVRMSQVDSYGGMQVFAGKNAIDKFVTVENTGRSDAYIRTLVAIEVGTGSSSFIGTSYHKTWEQNPVGSIEIDNNNYYVIEYTYNGGDLGNGSWRHQGGLLPGGDTSYPSLSQVYLKSAATNDDLKAIDGNKNGLLEILVLSQAVQADGFANAETALNAAFGDATSENVAKWFGEEDVTVPTLVDDADGLVKALESGEDVVMVDDVKIDPAGMSNAYGTTGINVKNGQTIYGNGNTLDIKGAGGTWDSGINTTGGLIKDLTVTGSFRGIFINHNSTHSEPVVLENVTIDGTTYTISCDQGMYQTFKATDSTFNGWTSYAADLGEAEFIDCYFGEGNGYAFCRPYAPTSFVGCEFEVGYKMDPRAAVTFKDCTIGGVALTADNLSTLVYTNTANATVK